MTTNATTLFRHAARAAAALALVASTSCSLANTKEPGLAGPSEYGYSINVRSHTDRLPQDGASVARVTATVLDQGGKPAVDFFLLWSVSASNGAFVEPSEQQTKTNAQGETTITVRAPMPPALLPASTARLSITARPVGHDALTTDNYRTIEVALVPPPGTLPVNNLPVPSFTVSPAVGNIFQTITFDASLTKDEGEPCESLCSYAWDFGNFETDSGKVVSKAYSRAATFTVVLTVTDSRGGVASTSRSVAINGPAAPVASFTATPATVSLATGATVVFNAIASTIGLGGTIEEYVWDFGDGTSQTTTL
ncbi:MAG TPA: PKD domain-containing protein, partial [Vicinamibacterales bacterium]